MSLRPAFPRRTVFVSYRHAEGRELLRDLVPALEAVTGDPARVVWDGRLPDDGSISGFVSVRAIAVVVAVNCKIAILRPFDIRPELLAIWLASRYGQNELRRRVRGAVQQGVILPDLKTIPIPRFSDRTVANVVACVAEAKKAVADSLNLYPEAEAELLDRIG